MNKEEKKIIAAFALPIVFVFLLLAIHFISLEFDWKTAKLGIYPKSLKGLLGIFTSPLIHGDYEHLFSNAIPLVILGTGIIYFYYPISRNVLLFAYLITGLFVWAFAREGAYHIGASGLVYAYSSFLFFSGVFKREKSAMGIALIVTFLYGSMIWGALPIVPPKISWESHLLGGLTGLLLAVYYRKVRATTATKEIVWDENEDVSHIPWQGTEENTDQADAEQQKVYINYTIVPEEIKLEGPKPTNKNEEEKD